MKWAPGGILLFGETLGVFTSTGVTGYTGIRVTFCNAFKWRKVTLLPYYRVTPVLVNTPIEIATTTTTTATTTATSEP